MIKKLRVTVDGKKYDVMVEMPDENGSIAPAPAVSAAPPAASPPPPQKIAAPEPPAAAPKASSGPGTVASPLAGRIAAIVATLGQEVKENDHLLTVEAMKMNTFVFAPKAGKVAEISIAVGDAVSEGQALARIE